MRGVTRTDLLLAGVFVLAAVVEAVVLHHDTPGLMVFQASGAGWLGALAVRRRRPIVPIGVLTVGALLGTVVTRLFWPDATDGGGVWIFALMLAAYSLGAHASGRALLLGGVLPLLVVSAVDATTRTGWARISGILFVTFFVGVLPTAVGRLVGIRRARLGLLRDQRRRLVEGQRLHQEAAAMRERLRATDRLRPTLVDGLRALADAAEAGADPGEIETSARSLLSRTREEVVALTAPVDTTVTAEVPAADHVASLRASSQRWVVLGAGAVAAGLAAESSATLPLAAPAWTVVPAAVVVGAAFALAWWRPVLAVAVGYAATAAYSGMIAPVDGSLAETALAMSAAFVVAALSTRPLAAVGLVVCVAGQLLGLGTDDPIGEGLVLVVCWLGGLVVNEATRLVEQTRVNNELLAGQDVEAMAVVRERLHLARELHDAIGHSLTVVALQAGAARRLVDTDEDRAAAVMRTVAAAAREGVAALEADAAPTGIGELVERVRATGLRVEADLSGEAGLDPGRQAVLSRVVQEALTNVLRHAPGARVRVVVRRYDDTIDLVVTNSPGAGPGAAGGTGHGLPSMRDRVAAVGGEVSWRGVDGGFEVHAMIPAGALAEAVP